MPHWQSPILTMHTPSTPHEFEPGADAALEIAQHALQAHADQRGSLLPILHTIQDKLGFIPDSLIPYLAEHLQLSRAEIHGVISFYAHFRSQAPAATILEVCRAEACQAMGGNALAEHAKRRLNCDFHAQSSNGRVSLEPVYCLGLCAQSPAIMLNGEPHARVSPEKLDALLQEQGALT